MEIRNSSVNSQPDKKIDFDRLAMKKLQIETLTGMRDQLASYAWEDVELSELVDPKLGIITGFQDLLDQLEVLRKVDLGDIPPAGDIKA